MHEYFAIELSLNKIKIFQITNERITNYATNTYCRHGARGIRKSAKGHNVFIKCLFCIIGTVHVISRDLRLHLKRQRIGSKDVNRTDSCLNEVHLKLRLQSL